MIKSDIKVGAVYFNYGPNFPRKVLQIEDNQVISVDVSYGHDFFVCPVATRYSSTLEEFASWAEVQFTISDIVAKKP